MADRAGQHRPQAGDGAETAAPAPHLSQPGPSIAASPTAAAAFGVQSVTAEALCAELVAAGAAVRRYLFGMCGDWHAAEDLAQDAMLRAWQKRDSFDGRSGMRTWLFAIARNAWLGQLRRRKTAVVIGPMISDEIAIDATPPHAAMARAELAAAVGKAMAKLPPEQREALAMRESEGLTFDQIAQVIGAPAATVKSRVRYALLKLAEELKPYAEGPET